MEKFLDYLYRLDQILAQFKQMPIQDIHEKNCKIYLKYYPFDNKFNALTEHIIIDINDY